MSSVTKRFQSFDAAHQLPFHAGKCSALHGHTYFVEVDVSGPIDQTVNAASEGMIVDFGILSSIYKLKIESICDHALLVGTTPLPWMFHLIPSLAGRVAINSADALMIQDLGIKKVAFLPIPVTTAEYLAAWMFGQFYDGVSAMVKNHAVAVEAVRVFETPTAYATATARFMPPEGIV